MCVCVCVCVCAHIGNIHIREGVCMNGTGGEGGKHVNKEVGKNEGGGLCRLGSCGEWINIHWPNRQTKWVTAITRKRGQFLLFFFQKWRK